MVIACAKQRTLYSLFFSIVLLLLRYVLHDRRFLSCGDRARVYLVGYWGKGHPVVLDPCACTIWYGFDKKNKGYVFEGTAGAYWD